MHPSIFSETTNANNKFKLYMDQRKDFEWHPSTCCELCNVQSKNDIIVLGVLYFDCDWAQVDVITIIPC